LFGGDHFKRRNAGVYPSSPPFEEQHYFISMEALIEIRRFTISVSSGQVAARAGA
jgi:hypothetical protein